MEIDIAALDKFSNLLGLIPPSYLYRSVIRKEDLKEKKYRAVQIHCLVSHQSNHKIFVYDSLPNNRIHQLLPQLKAMYVMLENLADPQSYITYVIGQLQGCTLDCWGVCCGKCLSLIGWYQTRHCSFRVDQA